MEAQAKLYAWCYAEVKRAGIGKFLHDLGQGG